MGIKKCWSSDVTLYFLFFTRDIIIRVTVQLTFWYLHLKNLEWQNSTTIWWNNLHACAQFDVKVKTNRQTEQQENKWFIWSGNTHIFFLVLYQTGRNRNIRSTKTFVRCVKIIIFLCIWPDFVTIMKVCVFLRCLITKSQILSFAYCFGSCFYTQILSPITMQRYTKLKICDFVIRHLKTSLNCHNSHETRSKHKENIKNHYFNTAHELFPQRHSFQGWLIKH